VCAARKAGNDKPESVNTSVNAFQEDTMSDRFEESMEDLAYDEAEGGAEGYEADFADEMDAW
jgi:hypothetical protein